MPDSYIDSSITLQKYLFNNNLLLNDIVKLTAKKIAFSTVSTNKEKMYIIIINILENKNIKVRYYSIDSFALYRYKIYLDIRIHKYKNFLAFASSFCLNQECEQNADEHYSALMIFSYPNSTDAEFYLDKYLFDNNITPRDVEIDLKKLLNIENIWIYFKKYFNCKCF